MRKLGKKPARASLSLAFTDFFDATKLPTPPAVFGHHAAVQQYHMLGNDVAGCCVWSGAAHQQYIWSVEGGRPRTRITTADVLSDYTACTGYDGTDATDNGTDMQDGAEYWRKTGIRDALGPESRHKIDCHVSLEIGNWDQMVLATYLFGTCGIGINLPNSAEPQFDNNHEPWSVVKGARVKGGHYIPAAGRDENGNILIISWGEVQPMMQEFYETYSDEARAYLSLDILDGKGISPEGFDLDALRTYVKELQGG